MNTPKATRETMDKMLETKYIVRRPDLFRNEKIRLDQVAVLNLYSLYSGCYAVANAHGPSPIQPEVSVVKSFNYNSLFSQ